MERFRAAVWILRAPTVSLSVAIALAYAHDRHGRSAQALEVLTTALADERLAMARDLPLLLVEAARVAVRVGPAQYTHAVAWLDRVEAEFADVLAARFDVSLAYYGTRVELATAFGNLDQIATWQRIERATLAQYMATMEQSGRADAIDRLLWIRERTHAAQAALALARDDEAVVILDELLADPLVRADENLARDLEARKRVATLRTQRMRELPADVESRLAKLAQSQDPERLLELRQIAVVALHKGDAALARRCVAVAAIDPEATPRLGSAGVNEGILLTYAVRFLREDDPRSPRIDSLVKGVRARFAAQLAAIHDAPLLEVGAGFLNYPELRQLLSYVIAMELAIDAGEAGKQRVLDWILLAQATGTMSRSLSLELPTLERIRERMLEPDEGAIVLLPAGPRSYLLAIDRDSLSIESLVAEGDLKAVRLGLRELLSTEPRHRNDSLAEPIEPSELEKVRASCAAFTKAALPRSIQERMRSWRSIVVIGADLMDGLAFEPLVLDGASQPLGETHTIRYLPSFALGLHVARVSEPMTDTRLFVLAATESPEAELPPIPFTTSDAADFAVPFGASNTSFVLGTAAIPSAFADPRAGAARIWLILAHGSFDPTSPLPAGIFLAPTAQGARASRIGVREVSKLSPPEIVLLAACGTQRGPLRKGDDGPQHLTGAFLRAGARTVVSSKGDLEYHATRALALEMVKRLAEGDSPSEALRKARIELRKSARFDHPFYYATWQIAGRG